jgi:arabinose-5-phosphate isomerase
MDLVSRAKSVFSSEIAELNHVAENIGSEFAIVVDAILSANGKVVVMGIGKTGIIGHKISSSLSSTGTSSIFVNAAEAMHGDLGMVASGDVAILISNSGSSSEILNVIAPLKKIGCLLVAMTGNVTSPLAKESDFVLNVGVSNEVCPFGLAPTTSTTATLLMGDALTVCLMEKRNFKPETYALYHPGGALGRRLISKVKDEMTTDIPKVYTSTTFKDILFEVSNKRLGMTLVYSEENKAVGIITDGDIRRAVQKFDDIRNLKANDFMTLGFKKIGMDELLVDALELMDINKITSLTVIESQNGEESVLGILSIHNIIDFR